MGEVFLAHDPLLGRDVALKRVLPSATGAEESRQRILREARAAARLEHPNVCTLYEVHVDDDAICLVMQYLDGSTVAERWRASAGGVNEILFVARGVAAALAEAHRMGIVHRDIKPQNVMLTSKGVKVLDFGLARFGEAAADQITQTGVVSGTTPYMSPEQLRLAEVDGRSDVFSFGVMLYELLAGRRPFDRPSVVETIAAILHEPPPPQSGSRGARATVLERLIERMLAKAAATRPTAAEVLKELDAMERIPDESASVPTVQITVPSAVTAAPLSSLTVIADPVQQKLYARGRHLLAKRAVPHLKEALGVFQEIIDLDPECAPAYAGLSDGYLLLGFLQALAPSATFPKARAAATRAVALQPERADAHATLGYISYVYDWNAAEAERELRHAIQLDDSFATAHHWLGLFLAARGRFDEARHELLRARDLDPLSPIFSTVAAFPDVYEHRLDEAIRTYDEIVELQPSFVPAHYYRGLALEQAGRLDEALAAFDRANELAPVKLEAYPAAIHVLGRQGANDEARRRLELLRAESRARYVPPLFFALAHLGIGEYEACCAALEESIEQHGVRLSELHLDRRFDALPDRERFAALLGRVGMQP